MGPEDSAVSATVIRSVLHIEASHTTAPEQLAADFADSLCRTGALVRARASGYVVLNPEHARLFDKHGWSKADVRAAIAEQGWRTYGDLEKAGKEAIAGGTGWRLPADHPDAVPQEAPDDPDTPVPLIPSTADCDVHGSFYLHQPARWLTASSGTFPWTASASEASSASSARSTSSAVITSGGMMRKTEPARKVR